MTKKQNKYASYGGLKHGMRHTKFYDVWRGMKARCGNKNHRWYHNYGGRGIHVCKEWLKFIKFKEDMHRSYLTHVAQNKNDTTMERINNNIGYYIHNCRWATRKDQAANFRKNVYIKYKGQAKTIAQWSIETGIKYHTLYSRIFTYKIDLDRAFSKSKLKKIKHG